MTKDTEKQEDARPPEANGGSASLQSLSLDFSASLARDATAGSPQSAKWDLGELFRSWTHWHRDFKSLPSHAEMSEYVEKNFRNRLSRNPHAVALCLDYLDSISRRADRLRLFVSLRLSENTRDEEAAKAQTLLDVWSRGAEDVVADVRHHVTHVSRLPSWLREEPLKKYRRFFKNYLRDLKLVSEHEDVLAEIPAQDHGSLQELLESSLTFPSARDSSGKLHEVTNFSYGPLMKSDDRVLRESTFRAFSGVLSQFAPVFASNLAAHLSRQSAIAKMRGAKNLHTYELWEQELSSAIFDRMIASVKERSDLLEEISSLRRKALKLQSLAPWDSGARYLSAGNRQKKFSYDEACRIVIESLAPLGIDIVNRAEDYLLRRRLVYRAASPHRSMTDMSSGYFDTPAYILLTWHGEMHEVFTLAHELGHSLHHDLARETQPYCSYDPDILISETASTLFETLLGRHLEKALPKEYLAEVIEERLDQFRGTVFNQAMLAAMQREMTATIETGTATLTASVLDEISKNVSAQFSSRPQIKNSKDESFHGKWALISHFFNGMYVCNYVLSFCASQALTQSLEKKPIETQAKIIAALRAGGSKSGVEILRTCGVDFSNSRKDPYPQAFAVLKVLLTSATAILDAKERSAKDAAAAGL